MEDNYDLKFINDNEIRREGNITFYEKKYVPSVDIVLKEAGLEIVAVTIQQDGNVKAQYIGLRRGVKSSKIDCIDIVKCNENDGLTPQEHYFGLKSFLEGLLQFGFVNLIKGFIGVKEARAIHLLRRESKEETNEMRFFKISYDINEKIIKALVDVAQTASFDIARMLMETHYINDVTKVPFYYFNEIDDEPYEDFSYFRNFMEKNIEKFSDTLILNLANEEFYEQFVFAIRFIEKLSNEFLWRLFDLNNDKIKFHLSLRSDLPLKLVEELAKEPDLMLNLLRRLLIQFQTHCPVTVYAALFEKSKRDTSNLEWMLNENELKYIRYGKYPVHKLAAIYDGDAGKGVDGEFMNKYFEEREMAYIFERALGLIETEMNLIRGPGENSEYLGSTLFNVDQTELESILIETRQGLMVILSINEQTFLCAIFKQKTGKGITMLKETAKKIRDFLKKYSLFFKNHIFEK